MSWAQRFRPTDRHRRGRDWFGSRLFQTVVISRFLPGLRLPTYTASGFFHADFTRFASAAILATLVWTSLLFGISLKLGSILVTHLGAWSWAGAIGFVLAILIATRVLANKHSST